MVANGFEEYQVCVSFGTRCFIRKYNDELQQRTFFKLDKLHSLHIKHISGCLSSQEDVSTFVLSQKIRVTLRRTTRSALVVALQLLANQSIQD